MKHKQGRQYFLKDQKLQPANHSVADRSAPVTEDPQVQTVWLNLQQSLGNQATAHLIQNIRLQTVPREVLPQVLRQAAEKDASEESTPAIDPTLLGLEQELPGHADKGEAKSTGSATATAASKPRTTNTGVAVALRLLAPTEDHSKTASQIAAAHGRPGAAGWTTPSFQITVSRINTFHIDVDVTVGFNIELAQEFKSTSLQILRDHEQGHVNIGTEQARKHLQVELKEYLEGLPGFTNPSLIQKGFTKEGRLYKADEGKESKTYDDLDYPRMAEAYQGAKTALVDLEKNSPQVASVAQAIRDFNILKPPLAKIQAPGAVQAILAANDILSEDDKAMLQYNPEFKKLLDQAAVTIGLWTVWLDRKAASDEGITGKLDLLTIMLDEFDWKPPV